MDIPLGICQCGCGRPTKIAPRTHRNRGWIKGRLLRFVDCHNLGRLIHGHTTHRRGTTPEYTAWRSMRQRCYLPSATGYKYGGGRGITVCKRWRESFPNFLADMGNKPEGIHFLDRINNDGNYEPGNCRWATPKQSANNRRRNGT